MISKEMRKRIEAEASKNATKFFDDWKSNGAVYQFGFFEFAHAKGYSAAGLKYAAMVEAIKAELARKKKVYDMEPIGHSAHSFGATQALEQMEEFIEARLAELKGGV